MLIRRDSIAPSRESASDRFEAAPRDERARATMPDDTPRRTRGPSWSRPITTHRPAVNDPKTVTASAGRDDATRAIVTRLARRHPSGGRVIERAAILAEGADCAAVVAWIIANRGEPEAALPAKQRGLHGARLDSSLAAKPRAPVRYVLPADVFT
jgi:hypothetical protein